MIAALVVALLLGASSAAVPSCSDVTQMVLRRTSQVKSGEPTTIEIQNSANTVVLGNPPPGFGTRGLVSFTVKDESSADLPTVTVDDITYKLFSYIFVPDNLVVTKPIAIDPSGSAALMIIFSIDGLNSPSSAVYFFVPLILTEEGDPAINADLNKDLSALLAVKDKEASHGGSNVDWLQQLVSKSSVVGLAKTNPELQRPGVKTFLTDCLTVSWTSVEGFFPQSAQGSTDNAPIFDD